MKTAQHEAISVVPNAEADSPQHEFVSDTFRASSTDIEEVREGMRRLGMDPAKREGKRERDAKGEGLVLLKVIVAKEVEEEISG